MKKEHEHKETEAEASAPAEIPPTTDETVPKADYDAAVAQAAEPHALVRPAPRS